MRQSVALLATMNVLFALAQYLLQAHIGHAFSGILSQDLTARLVRQPGFFLVLHALQGLFVDLARRSLICIARGRFLPVPPVTRIEDGPSEWPMRKLQSKITR